VETTGVDLLPGEKLLWDDRPAPRFFRGSDGLATAVVAGWLVFMNVVFGLTMRVAPAPFVSVVWAAFVAYGLYLLVGRLVVRTLTLRRTRYALTDRRLVVVGGFPWAKPKTTSAYVAALPPPVISERADGSGSLAFGAFPGPLEVFYPSNRGTLRTGLQTSPPVLWDLADVRRVRDLVARVQAAG
jgi:hypothetical protein